MEKNVFTESLEKELFLMIHWICLDADKSAREMYQEIEALGLTSFLNRYSEDKEQTFIYKIRSLNWWIIENNEKADMDMTTHPFYDVVSWYAYHIFEKHISEILNKSFILKIPKVVFPEEEKKKSLSFWDWLNTPVFSSKK